MKKSMRKSLFLLVTLFLLAGLVLTACQAQDPMEPSQGPATEAPSQATQNEPSQSQEAEDRTYTDSVGREVKIPARISHMVPSGPLAQIVLFTAVPDLVGAVAHTLSEAQLKVLGESYRTLPHVGQLYGKGDGFNLEAALMAGTQLIVDIGEAKGSIKDDLDEISQQINIPTVFIEATFQGMPETYRKIGDLVGDKERTDRLAEYCQASLDLAQKAKDTIPESDRVRVYWALGDLGLNTNAVGSFHSELLDYIPLINVADIEPSNRGGGSEVSMEQIIGWQPDYILVDGAKLADEMRQDPAWASLPAVKEGRMVIVPSVPYGYLADPPSVNRYAGLRWLGSIFYPEIYGSDTLDQIAEFYDLFYGIKANREDLEAILDGSFK